MRNGFFLFVTFYIFLACFGSGCKKREPIVPEPEGFVEDPGLAPATRALWVWETDVITNALARTELFAFCSREKVGTLFVNMSNFADHQYHQPYLDQVGMFLARSHDEGLRVHALRAMPMSPKLTYPKAQYVAVTYLRDFLKFNHGQVPEKSFDGYLIDVQPQLLPGWDENQDEIQQSFVNFVLEIYKTVLEFDTGLPLGWAMDASFDQYDWLAQVYGYLDYVVLLGYADDYDAIVKLAGDELDLAATTDTRVVIGLETRDLETEGEGWDTSTFYDEGQASLEQVVGELESGLSGKTSFGGVAIHDYKNFAALTGLSHASPGPAPHLDEPDETAEPSGSEAP